MDYEQALEWVHSLPRLAAHPGVENTRRLLEKLGNPEKSLRFVHVAGTNIIRQSGAFFLYGINGNKSQPASLNFNYKVYIINKAQKQKIRKQLEALGIETCIIRKCCQTDIAVRIIGKRISIGILLIFL